MLYLWIGLGGCAGALSRYWLGAYFAQRWPSAFPWGTLVINVSGAALMGLVVRFGGAGDLISHDVMIPITAGFLGAYTTFSTWMLETLRLVESRSYLMAFVNVLASVAAGLAAAAVGLNFGY